MQFGINLAPSADSWTLVKKAEELGLAHAWFIDSQLINADVFVAMTAAAMATARIHLGTGMLIPSNRIAPVAANALASLNKLAPGRIHFGVATGFTARRTMGLGPIRLAELKEYIRVVQGLLAGETVEWENEGVRRKIRFLNPDLDQINLADPIPLHISALAPRIRAMTAEMGARWVVPIGSVEGARTTFEAIRDSWLAAGRDPADLYVSAVGSGCVLADGEPYDSPRAKAQAGPGATVALHDMAEAAEYGTRQFRVPPHLESAVEAFKKIHASYEPADARYLTLHRGHLMIVRPEEERLVTAEMIRSMTITGRKEELRDKLRELRTIGFRQFTTHVRYGQPAMLHDWAEVFAGV
ncbi:MAG: LLM class flavin-dependent oxidoreductase [Rhodospirillales bacterium]